MQHDAPSSGSDDQFVSPGCHAYIQDQTTGAVKTFTGPAQCNPGTQEQPVSYNAETRVFTKTGLSKAISLNPLAQKGEYLVLHNPPFVDPATQQGRKVRDLQPQEAQEGKVAAKLMFGKTVNMPGPITFPLWPQQHATIIPGHRLRSNEYLIVRIVDEEEAKANWKDAVVREATPTSPVDDDNAEAGDIESDASDSTDDDAPSATAAVDDLDLSMGQLLIIKGEEVSFYIPPTGVEVLGFDDDGEIQYIRQACTLENLEYSILIDEDGNKRYEQGPDVIFPKPTEQFWTDAAGNRKFRAMELNDIQGIHIKVVAAYEDEEGDGNGKHKAGDELFLKGDKTPIYIPRVEHAIVQYGEGTKIHYGTTVPEGEGRYVLDRQEGKIETEEGPQVLLPDPRRYVMVRRPLSDNESNLWYPGNEASLSYNRELRSLGFSGKESGITEEAVRAKKLTRGVSPARSAGYETEIAAVVSADVYGAPMGVVPDEPVREQAGSAGVQNIAFERGTSYTQPRMLTLDTKFSGVPRICPWTGYAIQIVSASGDRTVVEGPATILLDYDQTLEVLHFSRGKMKQDEQRLATVYLRTKNNKVSDTVDVLTSDHIPISLRLTFLVDFDHDQRDRWFDVEDYIKLLTDHARSVLKGRIRRIPIQEFYEKSTEMIRDICLGQSVNVAGEDEPEDKQRPLMKFRENGMVVRDVDVLDVEIQDRHVRELLEQAQQKTIRSNIEVQQAEEQLIATTKTEGINRESLTEKQKTAKLMSELGDERTGMALASALAELGSELEQAEQTKGVNTAKQAYNDVNHGADLARKGKDDERNQQVSKAEAELEKLILEARTESGEKLFAAAKDGIADIALALSNDQTLEHVAKALSLQNAIGGGDVAETLKKAFEGTGLSEAMSNLTSRIRIPELANIGSGGNRDSVPE